MNKIVLIIQREFLTRVRKKSFIVMTILTPILFAALMVVPIIIATLEDTQERVIAVVDESGIFHNSIPETDYLKFVYPTGVSLEDLRETYKEAGYYGVLLISHVVAYSPDGVILYSDAQPPIDVTMHIASALRSELETLKLKSYRIENLDEILASIRTTVRVRTVKWTRDGEAKESSTELAMAIGYISSFLIYILIFMFGQQVMRGVVEEKTSRIIEVIVSSVRPFQLMMGKILGIAAVGLLQIILWAVLTIGIVGLVNLFFIDSPAGGAQQEAIASLMDQPGVSQVAAIANDPADSMIADILVALGNMNFVLILGGFLFFFLGGYLLYAAMFAAVGSAVDNDTDSQQMVLPITIPLILAIIVMISGIRSPDSALAFWFSIIPFTSPIIMLTRLPYGVPAWELALSATLLVAAFVVVTWMAARIYRVGILMYGKKHSWVEIWKWLRYRG